MAGGCSEGNILPRPNDRSDLVENNLKTKIEIGMEYGKPHHNDIAFALVNRFPDCEVFMYSPTDYGHSVDIVVEKDGIDLILVRIRVIRHDLDGV